MLKKEFLIPDTAHRVTVNTSQKINQQILRATIARLDEIGTDFEKIENRLNEIDKEWDIERMIDTQGSIALLTSLTLGLTVNKKFFAISTVVAGFLLLHATQGWCPPIPVLRRLGFRTLREIDDERYILLGRLGILPYRSSSSEEALTSLRHEH